MIRHLRHENVIALKDIMMPPYRRSFKDVYLVYELMDTDMHQIIKSPQPLSDDHCQYFLFQVKICLINVELDWQLYLLRILGKHLMLLVGGIIYENFCNIFRFANEYNHIKEFTLTTPKLVGWKLELQNLEISIMSILYPLLRWQNSAALKWALTR